MLLIQYSIKNVNQQYIFMYILNLYTYNPRNKITEESNLLSGQNNIKI